MPIPGILVAVDFETTGYTDGFDELPLQIGLAVMADGRLLPEYNLQTNLQIPADHPINPFARAVHKLRRQDLAGAPRLVELWPHFAPWVAAASCWVAHNAHGEKKFLQGSFPLHHIGPWKDTYRIARKRRIPAPHLSLTELLHHAGHFEETKRLSGGREPHEALFDAVGCLLLLQWLENGPLHTTAPCEHPCELQNINGI